MEKTKLTEAEILNFAERLNQEKFSGLEGYSVGDAMYFAVMPRESFSKKKFKLRSLIKSLIVLSFIRKVAVYRDSPMASKYFLYSNSYAGRKEHRNTFDKVAGLVPGKAIFCPVKKFSLFNLHNFFKPFLYHKILKKFFMANDAWYYAVELAKAYKDFNFIVHNMEKSKPKLLTVFCDVHMIDSLAVQYCNKNGIATATMQHGNLSRGPAYSLSKSKYFLGYGEYTKKIAEESGMNVRNFISCGMPNYIGKQLSSRMVRNNTDSIGVVFCDYTTIEDDTKMLNAAIDFAAKNKYKVFVKLHPACPAGSYKDVGWNKVEKTYGKEISIYDFMNLIDFAVIGASTAFIEYVVSLFPCLNFACRNDKYAQIIWNKFKTSEELETHVSMLKTSPDKFEENLKRTREYFTPTSGIEENYKHFFEKF